MALDDFIDGDSLNSPSSSSTSSSTNTQQRIDNSPSNATQAFIDRPEVTPRAIKYQIKTINANWGYTHSTDRLDGGELVMYTAGSRKTTDDTTLAVYTTISSIVDTDQSTDQTDIVIRLLDLTDETEIIREEAIGQTDDWKQTLLDKIKQFVRTQGDTAITTENFKTGN